MDLVNDRGRVDNSFGLYIRRFFSGTLLSRVSGLVRDLMMAFAFGDQPAVAAFFVAFRLSNLFRRLFGEGPLQTAFIPHFEGLRVADSVKASYFFRNMVVLISFLLIGLTLVVEGGIAGILSVYDLSEGNREILSLTSWLFPGLLFICLYGLNISLLNCYDSFFIPSVAPFICNTIWIAAAFFLRNHDPAVAMVSLSKWIVIGFIGQWLLTLPLTVKHTSFRWREWVKVKISPEIIRLIKSFSLGAIGVGAVQINTLADAIFSRYVDIRGPTYLWYSIRLEQLALAILGIACISTIAPRLSRAIKSSNLETGHNLFTLCYKRVMTIMIPCTFAIIALGLASVNLIYGRGHFSEEAVMKTTACLWAYGLSLLPTTLIMLFSIIFYANSNFKTPTIISVIAVVLNLLLNYFFVFILQLGVISIALATSLSAAVNGIILFRLIRQRGWKTQFSLSRIFKLTLASFVGLLSVYAVDYLFFDSNNVLLFIGSASHYPQTVSAQLGWFSALSMAFACGFFGFSIAFKNNDILSTIRELFGKKTHLPAIDSQV